MFRLVSKPSVAFSTVYDINGVDGFNAYEY